MRQQSTWGRRTFTALLASGVAVGAVIAHRGVPLPTPRRSERKAASPEGVAGRGRSARHDADLLAKAEAEEKPQGHPHHRHRQGQGARRRRRGQEARRRPSTRRFDKVGYVLAPGAHRQGAQGREAARRRGDRPRRDHPAARTRPPSRAGKSGGQAGPPLPGPGPTTPAANPYMPTQRDRRGRLQAEAPDLGRPRRDDRHHGLGCRPRPPGPADHHHRRAQDRRLGDRDRPGARGRRHLARDAHRGQPARPFTFAGGDLDTAPAGKYRFNRFAETHHRGQRARRATSTATATPPTVRHPLRPGQPRHPGRREPEPRLHRRRR